jgi:hypothetical protein
MHLLLNRSPDGDAPKRPPLPVMRRSEGETGSIGVGFRALFSPDDAGNEKGRLKDGPNVVTEVLLLLNDLDDTACSRLDQNRAAIDHRVSVLAYAILRRHVVVGHAFFRQNGTNSQVFPILIRRTPLFDHIGTEAGTLIHPEDAGYAANDPSDHAANDGSDRTCCPFTVAGTPLDTARDTLGLGCNRKQQGENSNSSSSGKTADHENSLDEGLGANTSSQRRIGSRPQ